MMNFSLCKLFFKMVLDKTISCLFFIVNSFCTMLVISLYWCCFWNISDLVYMYFGYTVRECLLRYHSVSPYYLIYHISSDNISFMDIMLRHHLHLGLCTPLHMEPGRGFKKIKIVTFSLKVWSCCGYFLVVKQL